MNPDISIIIPVYGVEDYIEECLRSVMAQKAVDKISVECILVDDLGTDKSMDIAAGLIAAYEGPVAFKIVRRRQNGGLSAARNSGLAEARGRYVYFLDSDDVIAPHCLESLWALAKVHPGVDVVYGKTENFPDVSTFKSYLDFQQKGALPFSADPDHIHSCHLYFPEIACNKLILREWLEASKLTFTEGIIHEDLDWHLRAYFFIRSYACTSGIAPTYLYRQREKSITNDEAIEKRMSVKTEILSRIAADAPFWDKDLIRFYMYHIIFLRDNEQGMDSATAKKLYDRAVSAMCASSTLPVKYKLLTKATKIPRRLSGKKIIIALSSRI